MAKKPVQKTDFGELGDSRLNKVINIEKISSKEEYVEKLTKYLTKKENGERLVKHIDKIYEESNAHNIIEKNALEIETSASALRMAQKIERARPRRSRIRDESRTAKVVLPVTRRNIQRWKRGKFRRVDLKSIDTRLPRARRGNDSNMLTKADLKLKKYSVTVNSDGRKVYRDGQGMFVSAKKLARKRKRR